MLSLNHTNSYNGRFIPGWKLIAVYWTDLITEVQGNIYYRESRDISEQFRVRSLIRENTNDFRFNPTYLWIITWDDVHEYSLNNKVSIEEGITLTFYILDIFNIIDFTLTSCIMAYHFRSSHLAAFGLALNLKWIQSKVLAWEFFQIFGTPSLKNTSNDCFCTSHVKTREYFNQFVILNATQLSDRRNSTIFATWNGTLCSSLLC